MKFDRLSATFQIRSTKPIFPVFLTEKVIMTRRSTAVSALLLVLAVVGLSACGSSSSGGSSQVAIVAYSTPQAAFEKLTAAFKGTPEGKGIDFSQSYGP